MTQGNAHDRRQTLLATGLIGLGCMAAIDEIVFHQILAWHHFFDWSTPAFGLMSDGLLHSAELILTVLGFFLFAGLRSRKALVGHLAWGGFFIGLGAFQLFDGIINHKVLRLHQIREAGNLWHYDLAWNGTALVLLAIGLCIIWRRRG